MRGMRRNFRNLFRGGLRCDVWRLDDWVENNETLSDSG